MQPTSPHLEQNEGAHRPSERQVVPSQQSVSVLHEAPQHGGGLHATVWHCPGAAELDVQPAMKTDARQVARTGPMKLPELMCISTAPCAAETIRRGPRYGRAPR